MQHFTNKVPYRNYVLKSQLYLVEDKSTDIILSHMVTKK